MKPSVCSIVLAYGSRDDVARALDSLLKANQHGHVLLIQNGLSDSDTQQLAQLFPTVQVVYNSLNRGAAGGRNLAFRTAQAWNDDYYFFLDRDAYIQDDAIDQLIQSAESHPDAGFVSCLVLSAENHTKIHSAGGSFHPRTLSEVHYRDHLSQPVMPVDFVITTAALVKAQVLKHVGFFDERYFAYYEDLDWAFRSREQGYRHYIVASALAFHNEERSRFHPLVVYYMSRNRLLFYKTHHWIRGIFDMRVWRLFVKQLIVLLHRILVLSPLALTCLGAYLNGFYDFAIGRWGPGPKWINQPSDAYFESRMRAWILAHPLYAKIRRLKKHFLYS
jgi:GT2 family glycosyltransferase